MFSQEVPCRSSASNASCFRVASALGIHDEYSDVLFSLLTLFTMCCLWLATALPLACQWMRALLSSFVNCRQGVWKWYGSGFCFSESTSSMPARNWQCRGQSFLLLVRSKDKVILQSSLCSNGCGTDLVMNMNIHHPNVQQNMSQVTPTKFQQKAQVTSNTGEFSKESKCHK